MKYGRLPANEWRGTVSLNGVDVSDRCAAVLVRGETPVAVVLHRHDAQGRMFLYPPGHRRVSREVRCGEIVYSLRRRDTAGAP